MQPDHTVTTETDLVTLQLPRDVVRGLVQVLKSVQELATLRQQLVNGAGSNPAADPHVAWLEGSLEGSLRGLIDRLAGVAPRTDLDIEACARVAWASYAHLHGLEESEDRALEQPVAVRGTYRRPIRPWVEVATLLLEGLIATEHAHQPPPFLKEMCQQLQRNNVRSAPTSAATLSRWVSESRRLAGLSGGYRAAVAELLPEARRAIQLHLADAQLQQTVPVGPADGRPHCESSWSGSERARHAELLAAVDARSAPRESRTGLRGHRAEPQQRAAHAHDREGRSSEHGQVGRVLRCRCGRGARVRDQIPRSRGGR